MAEEKWMQKIAGTVKKGALHAQLDIPQGEKIPTSRLTSLAHSPKASTLLKRRVNLALNYRGK
jgi:hypothetical protein